jgi:uncharacterized membrane protein
VTSRLGRPPRDEAVEQLLGNLLRAGVVLAAVVTAVGGILYLAQYGGMPAGHRVFAGEPAELRSVRDIIAGALALRSRSVIQLGLLLLIATPIARVAFALLAFARQRDGSYVLISALVLGLLLFSLGRGG